MSLIVRVNKANQSHPVNINMIHYSSTENNKLVFHQTMTEPISLDKIRIHIRIRH